MLPSGLRRHVSGPRVDLEDLLQARGMLGDQVVERQEQPLRPVELGLGRGDDAEDDLRDVAAGEHQVELALRFLLRHQLPVDVDVRLLLQPLREAVVVEVGDVPEVVVEEAEGDRLLGQRLVDRQQDLRIGFGDVGRWRPGGQRIVLGRGRRPARREERADGAGREPEGRRPRHEIAAGEIARAELPYQIAYCLAVHCRPPCRLHPSCPNHSVSACPIPRSLAEDPHPQPLSHRNGRGPG